MFSREKFDVITNFYEQNMDTCLANCCAYDCNCNQFFALEGYDKSVYGVDVKYVQCHYLRIHDFNFLDGNEDKTIYGAVTKFSIPVSMFKVNAESGEPGEPGGHGKSKVVTTTSVEDFAECARIHKELTMDLKNPDYPKKLVGSESDYVTISRNVVSDDDGLHSDIWKIKIPSLFYQQHAESWGLDKYRNVSYKDFTTICGKEEKNDESFSEKFPINPNL